MRLYFWLSALVMDYYNSALQTGDSPMLDGYFRRSKFSIKIIDGPDG